jgi:hypothetical protein
MKKNMSWGAMVVFGFAFGFFDPARAQNFPVVHWINDAGQDGATALNTNGVFITDFKGHNDVKVTALTSDEVFASWDTFGSPPGNNPAYLTNFLGVASNGTGDGSTPGYLVNLNMTSDNAGSLQFDFSIPLTPQDRVLIIDVDGPEQYLIQAYTLSGSSYVSANLTGWNAEDFSGSTGITPNNQWPVWNASTGTLTSGTTANLNEELFTLTPDQNISRLVVTKQNGASWSTDITFVSVVPTLLIQKSGGNVVLSWGSPNFSLQSASTINGVFATVPGATSPYTNAISGSQQFFRLKGN